jgi:hypothetical protein
MTAPTSGTVTSSSISVSFTTLTTAAQIRAPAILSYTVQYKLSTASTYTSITGVSSSPVTISSLVPASSYDIVVYAINVQGSGTPSTALTVTTLAAAPDAPINVVTAVTTNNLGVTISWSDGASDNGDPITGYNIYIQQSNSLFSIDTTDCDGVTNTTIITNRNCTIPMATLRAAPYSLTYGSNVIAMVAAENTIGWSANSTQSPAGTTVLTPPV